MNSTSSPKQYGAGFGQSGANQATVLVFKDQKQLDKGLKNASAAETAGEAKKISASGRPIRKTAGRLSNLRTIQEPKPGIVQLNFPV